MERMAVMANGGDKEKNEGSPIKRPLSAFQLEEFKRKIFCSDLSFNSYRFVTF